MRARIAAEHLSPSKPLTRLAALILVFGVVAAPVASAAPTAAKSRQQSSSQRRTETKPDRLRACVRYRLRLIISRAPDRARARDERHAAHTKAKRYCARARAARHRGHTAHRLPHPGSGDSRHTGTITSTSSSAGTTTSVRTSLSATTSTTSISSTSASTVTSSNPATSTTTSTTSSSTEITTQTTITTSVGGSGGAGGEVTGASAVEPGPLAEAGGSTGWDGLGAGVFPGPNWRPYAATSPFNIGTAAARVHALSSEYVRQALVFGPPANLYAGTAGTTSDWAHPTYFAQPGDPLYTLHATEEWGKNEINGIQIPIPEYARPAGGEDGHMTVVTPEGWEYDFWRAQIPPKGGGTFSFAWGGRTRIDGTGTGSGGTASGFGNLAGMIRAPELKADRINHALFMTIKCAAPNTLFGDGAAGASQYSSSYVYPATGGGSPCPSGYQYALPLGAWLKLEITTAELNALSVPAWERTILVALREYGAFCGDTGGPGMGFMFESSESYIAQGRPDPLVEYARENDIPQTSGGLYAFSFGLSAEWWADHLRVLEPPAQA
jgi:hypothetical protein